MESNTKTLADQIRELPDDKVAIANVEGVCICAISDLLNQPIEVHGVVKNGLMNEDK